MVNAKAPGFYDSVHLHNGSFCLILAVSSLTEIQYLQIELSVNEVTKSIDSQTYNKSTRNDGLTAEFYKHFSSELSPALLDFYDSREKLGTIHVSSKT